MIIWKDGSNQPYSLKTTDYSLPTIDCRLPTIDYSTVTDLARFLGLSTSYPFATPM